MVQVARIARIVRIAQIVRIVRIVQKLARIVRIVQKLAQIVRNFRAIRTTPVEGLIFKVIFSLVPEGFQSPYKKQVVQNFVENVMVVLQLLVSASSDLFQLFMLVLWVIGGVLYGLECIWWSVCC